MVHAGAFSENMLSIVVAVHLAKLVRSYRALLRLLGCSACQRGQSWMATCQPNAYPLITWPSCPSFGLSHHVLQQIGKSIMNCYIVTNITLAVTQVVHACLICAAHFEPTKRRARSPTSPCKLSHLFAATVATLCSTA